MARSKITIANCQIKSVEKLEAVCQALDILEKEAFIGSGTIRFKNVFVCPDIDLIPFIRSSDPMQRLVGRLCIGLHLKRYGRHSDRRYVKWAKKYNRKYQ